MAVGLANPFTDFLTLIADAKLPAKVACAPALKYYRAWVRQHPTGTFGQAIDALASGEATEGDMTLASMWARWCLGLHADGVLPEVRDRFVEIMSGPAGNAKVCYQYLVANKAVLTEREIMLLRNAIHGKLPSIADAETI